MNMKVVSMCLICAGALLTGCGNGGKKEAEKTAFYAEYESTGEGANPKARVPFSHQLKNLKGYEIDSILTGEDGWNPVKNGNELLSIKR
jgi:pectinesterase